MSAEATPRWTRRPEGSNWGDFGPDDRIGRMNLLTAEKVRQGLAEVRDYASFSLGLPLTLPGGTALNPNRLPPIIRPNLRSGAVNANCRLDRVYPGSTDIMNDDLAILHTQYSTQWDALSHVGSLFDADGDGIAEPVYYNGYRPEQDITGPSDIDGAGLADLSAGSTFSAGPLGIDALATRPVQGRAVMIDLHAHLGDTHTVVGYETLADILETDGVVVEEADIVCLHTGFAEKVLHMDGTPDAEVLHRFGAVLDGRDPELLRWITDTGIAAIAADNYAVELYPARPAEAPASVLPLHEHCLFRLGVHLGELWRLTPLAAHLRGQGRSRFLLTAPPLNLPGAAGSPLNPIATV